MEINSPRFYEFGEFKIDSRRRVLTRDNQQIAISAKNFDLLFFMVQNEGRILSHDEILDSVWEGTFVEQSNLKKGISAIRQILGETPESSNYIKTIPRKGYSFVAPVKTYLDEPQPIRFIASEIVIEEEIIENNQSSPTQPKPEVPKLAEKAQNSRLKFAVPIIIAILLTVGIFYWYFSRNQKPTQFTQLKLENLKPQRLSTNGDINEATLSNDGKFFVYALRDGEGNQSLWLRRIGTMSALNLVPSAKVDYRSVVVSNDNDSVFYSISIENSKDNLFQIPILGGTPRRVLDDIASFPTFSPDGKKIGVLRDNPGVGRSLLVYNLEKGQEEGEIYSVKGDNHGIISPKYSPKGDKFAFISSEKTSNGRIWVLNEISAGGGIPRQLFPARKGKIYDFRWLNDGSGIVMVADLNDNRHSQIWKVNLQNGEISRLTNDLLDYSSVDLSNDGKSILTVQEVRQADLWKSDFANPGQAQQISQNINLPNRFDLLPDGRFIAESLDNAVQTLSIIKPNESGAQQFLPQPSWDRAPSVSPDGKSIYYVSRLSGADQIWRADLNGSNAQKLTDYQSFLMNPKISPDGNYLFYEQYRDTGWKLVKMPKNGGETILISEDTVRNSDFSPDGKLLAYNFLNPQTQKWKIRLRNLADNSIFKDFDSVVSSFVRFTPDGKSLIFNLSDFFRDGGNVWIQPIEGGAAKPFIELKNERIYWAKFSQDGKTLYYTRGKTTASAVLLSLETSK